MVIHSKALQMPELSHNGMFYNDVFTNLMALAVGWSETPPHAVIELAELALRLTLSVPRLINRALAPGFRLCLSGMAGYSGP